MTPVAGHTIETFNSPPPEDDDITMGSLINQRAASMAADTRLQSVEDNMAKMKSQVSTLTTGINALLLQMSQQ